MDTVILQNELIFKAVRSSGPGGQHANKVSSKVQLIFDLENSKAFTEEERSLLYENLKSKLTKENSLIMTSEASRSQHKNKEIVIEKFDQMIKEALKVPVKRKATKPKKSAVKKRLETKKKQALKKALRKDPRLD